jgi:hypothetical protein
MLKLAVLSILFACIADAAAGQTVSRAFCGEDGKAHLVYAGAPERTISPEEKQVGCADITVAEDGRTVGWAVQVDNCCTSYPIPVAVVLLNNGRKTVLPCDQVLWQWRFIDQGKRVAILTGPVHGWASAADLYDSHTAKRLKIWEGSGETPEWAHGWEGEFVQSAEKEN